VCEKTVEIKEQRTKMDEAIETLDMKLTIVADRIKEVDQATEGMANFLDAAKAQQMESMHEANGIAGSIKRAKQKLIDNQNRLQTNITSTPMDIKDAEEAIHREGKLVSGEIRKERDRILKNIMDKDQSSRDELQKRTDRSIDRITGIGIDTMDNMDIKAATALDRAESTVNTVINGTDFIVTLRQRIDAYIESYSPTMQDIMYGFTETYFKNNEQLHN
jgi:chromosome segregation ATPase